MRALKGLLKLWAVVMLLVVAGLMFVSITPALINADSNLGIPLALLMWVTFIYCLGVTFLKFSLNNKENNK